MYGRLGLIYFQEGKFEQAVPVLRQALKMKPGLPNTDVLLAMSLSELGHYEEALPGLEKGFRRSSDQPLGRMSGLQLLRTYTGLQRDSQAVEAALELDRSFPNDPEVLYHTSRIYANFAYMTLHRLSQVAPNSIWKLQAEAEADESQGNAEQAVREYRRVLALDPQRRGIHYRIGRVLISRARTQQADSQVEAIKEFQQELALDPTNANAAYEMGEIYRKAGRLDEAQECFRKALEYYPDFEEAQLGLGGVLLTSGKPDQALPHLQKAVALDANDEVGYYRLSQAYKALGKSGQQQKALAEFQQLRSQAHANVPKPDDVTKQQIESAQQ